MSVATLSASNGRSRRSLVPIAGERTFGQAGNRQPAGNQSLAMEIRLVKLFFSYSHVDEDMRDQLEVQLSMLKRQGIIETWHDRRIGAGQEIESSISSNLETADIVLLLVSPNFLASDYCYDREMMRAMERHEAREAIVIPVILRACDWHPAPFGKLNASPNDGKPIRQAVDPDQAFLEVAKAIREAASRLTGGEPTATSRLDNTATPALVGDALPRTADIFEAPRSSNLRVTKRFTDQDKDAFKLDTFEFMAFFRSFVAGIISAQPRD